MKTNASPLRRLGQRLVSSACALLTVSLLAALAVPSRSFAQSLSFSDPLAGPSSPNLSIPFTKYGYLVSGLVRTQDDGSGVDRVMVKTVSGAYLTTDFTFEVDVFRNSTSDMDINFIGFGQGTPNADYFNEPTNAFVFRIHNVFGFYRIDAAVEASSGAGGPLPALNDSIANFASGVKMRFRITRSGDTVTLSVPSQNASASFSISQWTALLGLNNSNCYLFFGSSLAGTVFSDATVTLPTPPSDTTPPVIASLTASSTTLWPPNHKMVAITLSAVASDNVGVTSLRIIAVASSEPDNGLGDGDTAGDIQFTGDLTLNLRAERSGKGNGRTYTITVEARDAAGNKSYGTTTVSVPKSQGGK